MKTFPNDDEDFLYSFSLDSREYGKNGIAMVLALAFAFFFLESFFIGRWISHHPVSFYFVNGLFVTICIFSLIISNHVKKTSGNYAFTITERWVTCKSPHRMMGNSYKIDIGSIVRLERVFSCSSPRPTIPNAYRIVHTRGAVFVNQFPGHSGHDVFDKLTTVRRDVEAIDVILSPEDYIKTL